MKKSQFPVYGTNRVFPAFTFAYSTLLPFPRYIKVSLSTLLLFVGVSISEKIIKWKY